MNREQDGIRRYHGLMKAAIVLIALCGGAICAVWFPYSVLSSLSLAGEAGNWFWTQFVCELCFFYAAAAPCYIILVQLWKVSELIADGKLFSLPSAMCFAKSAKILLFDLLFFLAGNTVLFVLGKTVWFWVHVFLCVCGCAVALLFFVISQCLREGAVLQEESDGTI